MFILLAVFANSMSFTQISSQVLKDSLSVSEIVKYKNQANFENHQVEFKSVTNDSRCPKDVMCIRAGEAYVIVSIFEDGKFIEDKKIKINGGGYVMEATNLIFDTEDFKIYGIDLLPYPIAENPVIPKDYELEIVFKLKRLK